MKTVPKQPKDPMTRKALKALQEAVAITVEEHRREHRPIAEWQNGRAVLVPVDQPAATVREQPTRYKTRSHGKKR
jgi:hypothetical protein